MLHDAKNYLNYHPCPLLTQAGKSLGNQLFPCVRGEPEGVVVARESDFFHALCL